MTTDEIDILKFEMRNHQNMARLCIDGPVQEVAASQSVHLAIARALESAIREVSHDKRTKSNPVG